MKFVNNLTLQDCAFCVTYRALGFIACSSFFFSLMNSCVENQMNTAFIKKF